jgi:ferredoxin
VSAFTATSLVPYFHPNVWIVRVFSRSVSGLVFLGLLAASSLFGRRLWCVYLCPLGALFGLLAQAPLPRLRITRCSRCGACSRCPMQAADGEGRAVLAHQCILCFELEASCPVAGFGYRSAARERRAEAFDPSRRRFLITSASLAGGALLGGLLASLGALAGGRWASGGSTLAGGRSSGPQVGGSAGRATPASGSAPHTTTSLLRPPGVADEAAFLRRCLRCLHCVQSCPNQIIAVSGMEGGIAGLFTPRLRFDRYGCDFRCQVCQLVCPNGAIPRQTLAEKQETPIGIASIDEQTCVVFKDSTPCLVCEEVCPTPQKAIVFSREKRIRRPSGSVVSLKFPSVEESRCIGCGICQANCPADQPAITVSRKHPPLS